MSPNGPFTWLKEFHGYGLHPQVGSHPDPILTFEDVMINFAPE